MQTTGKVGSETYQVVQLGLQHIPDIEALQQIVVDALPDPNILQPLSMEELRNILTGNGLMIGLYIEETLIAFRALLDPGEDDEHLGRDAKIPEAQLNSVLYQEISNVHPAYRGYRLQQRMAEYIMQFVDQQKYQYICATVMPGNIASLKDKFAQNMYITALKLKYGGKLRYVFMKELSKEAVFTDDLVEIEMNNTKSQQFVIKEGYLGVELTEKDGKWFVLYKKIKK